MKANAVIRLEIPFKEHLETVYPSLFPEAVKPASSRSKVWLKIERDHLILTIEARDAIALRASLNAYLRWISSICDVLSIIDLFS
ncbi:MAG: KEOPS complex subunit Pcc1 [Candidatus Bathyarchaeia archaeon]|nr:hypothetical protein [Candidatus Bathyarchaeota archaeon]